MINKVNVVMKTYENKLGKQKWCQFMALLSYCEIVNSVYFNINPTNRCNNHIPVLLGIIFQKLYHLS